MVVNDLEIWEVIRPENLDDYVSLIDVLPHNQKNIAITFSEPNFLAADNFKTDAPTNQKIFLCCELMKY
jgi:hypothetical protein